MIYLHDVYNLMIIDNLWKQMMKESTESRLSMNEMERVKQLAVARREKEHINKVFEWRLRKKERAHK